MSLGKTPPFVDEQGAIIEGSIAEVSIQRLGGLDQWVMMRGLSVQHPPLIFLHGGPGFSETRSFRHHNHALERQFTVVYWDQRGAGKSFDASIPKHSMTLDQFLIDLDELVDIVRKRLGQQRVAIFGHSWGSFLGVVYAARHPDKVSVYAGSGQLGDWPASEAASYAEALAMAEDQADDKAMKQLVELGPPPHDAEGLWAQRTLLQILDGQLTAKSLWTMGRIFLEGPEYSVVDLARFMRSFKFSLGAMWEEVSRLRLIELAPSLSVPVVLLLGRHDRFVPPQISVDFFEALEAPQKEIVWFEGSGHEPFIDEPELFNQAMIDKVLPPATSP